jgi:glycosyltransferase involved in cell wall biosynthesis
LINENRIDIIHSHSYKADFITVLIKWLSGKKIVATIHGFNPASVSIKSRLIWIFFRYIWLFFDQVILVSEVMLKIRIFKLLDKLGKVNIIENFIPELPLRQSTNDLENKIFTIVSIGRLAYEKNQILLCKALKLISTERNFQCYLVGDGPERKKIKKYINEEGLNERIKLVGFQSDVVIYYGCADVVVIPSLYEGLPIVGHVVRMSSDRCKNWAIRNDT